MISNFVRLSMKRSRSFMRSKSSSTFFILSAIMVQVCVKGEFFFLRMATAALTQQSFRSVMISSNFYFRVLTFACEEEAFRENQGMGDSMTPPRDQWAIPFFLNPGLRLRHCPCGTYFYFSPPRRLSMSRAASYCRSMLIAEFATRNRDPSDQVTT